MVKAQLGWPLMQWTAQGADMEDPPRSPQAASDAVIGNTADGEIIVNHDSTLDRCSNGTG